MHYAPQRHIGFVPTCGSKIIGLIRFRNSGIRGDAIKNNQKNILIFNWLYKNEKKLSGSFRDDYLVGLRFGKILSNILYQSECPCSISDRVILRIFLTVIPILDAACVSHSFGNHVLMRPIIRYSLFMFLVSLAFSYIALKLAQYMQFTNS